MSRYILRAWRLWVQKVTVILFIWKLLYVVHKELSRRQSRWLPALPMRDMDHHALLQLRTLEEVKWPAYSHKTSRSSTRTQVSDSKPRLLFPLHIEGCLSLITTNAKWQGWNGLFLKIFPALNSLSFSDSGVLCKKKKKINKEMFEIASLSLSPMKSHFFLWNTRKGWRWWVYSST